MSKDSSNALLHSKPLLFWIRERSRCFSEEQTQTALSSGSCGGLHSDPAGGLKGACPPAPSQGAAGSAEGLQLSVCLILSPEEGLCQMFPSIQGLIHLSRSCQILKVKKKKKSSNHFHIQYSISTLIKMDIYLNYLKKVALRSWALISKDWRQQNSASPSPN